MAAGDLATFASGGGEEPTRVFLSYRRTDDPHFVGRFHDRLIDVFGDSNVFRDLDSLHGGSHFIETIRRELGQIDAVVAIIGPTWAARLREPGDFVKMEVSEALAHGVPIIPILIEDTSLPTADQLPDDVRPLLAVNALRVRRDPDFRRDATKVIHDLNQEVARSRQHRADQAAIAAETERQAALQLEQQRLDELERRLAERRQRASDLEAEEDARRAELQLLEQEHWTRRLETERAQVARLAESKAEANARVAEAEIELEQARSGERTGVSAAVELSAIPEVRDSLLDGAPTGEGGLAKIHNLVSQAGGRRITQRWRCAICRDLASEPGSCLVCGTERTERRHRRLANPRPIDRP